MHFDFFAVNIVQFCFFYRLTIAHRELLGMAAVVLHIVHTAGRIFRAKYVRRRGGGKLPPVPGRTRERRARPTAGQTGQADGKKAEK